MTFILNLFEIFQLAQTWAQSDTKISLTSLNLKNKNRLENCNDIKIVLNIFQHVFLVPAHAFPFSKTSLRHIILYLDIISVRDTIILCFACFKPIFMVVCIHVLPYIFSQCFIHFIFTFSILFLLYFSDKLMDLNFNKNHVSHST